jgi:hydrogenase maturation protease
VTNAKTTNRRAASQDPKSMRAMVLLGDGSQRKSCWSRRLKIFEAACKLGVSPVPNCELSNSNKPAPSSRGLLVIGYGNTLRSDDGVGPRVVEAVAALELQGVTTLTRGLLTPELAEPIAQAARVIFVDAAVDAPREVQLRPLAPAESCQIMAHTADPRTLLALARDVFGRAPEAWWLTIPVENIDIGEELSPFAQSGLGSAVQKIRALAP